MYLRPFHASSYPLTSRSIEKLKLEDSPLRWSCSSLASISSKHSLESPVSRDTAVLELEAKEAVSREQRTELLHTPVTNPKSRVATQTLDSAASPPQLKQSIEPSIPMRSSRTISRRDEYSTGSNSSLNSFHFHEPMKTQNISLHSSSSYYSLLRSLRLEQASSTSLRSSITPSSVPSLWRVERHVPEFCYITPKQNLLLHSSSSICYFVQLKTKRGQQYHRLCQMKSSPLQLHVSTCSPDVLDELQHILEVTPRSSVDSSAAITGSGQLLSPISANSSLLSSCTTTKYASTNLPSSLRRHYQFVTTLLALLPSKLPKLTLYLRNPTAFDDVIDKAPIFCKCILMSNLPLPDFLVRFANAFKIHYALDNGHLTISQPGKNGQSLVLYEGDMNSTSNWCEFAPKEFHKYILTSQKAMQMCLVLSGQQSCCGKVVMGGISDQGAIILDDDT